MKTIFKSLVLTLTMTLGFSAAAQDISKKDYVMGNTLLTLYHEFGHALVSELGLPVLGKEEDAVDAFSIIAITDKLGDADNYDDDQAAQLETYLFSTADVWMAYAESEEPDESSYAAEHSLDIQRFYAHVCLVYGSDPEFHEPLLADLGVEPELVEDCEERFAIAAETWDDMLYLEDEPVNADIQISIKKPDAKKHKIYADWLKDWPWLKDFEKSLEQRLNLQDPISVNFQSCDDENAYWDPENQEVTFCYELMDVYAQFYDEIQ